MLEKERGVGRFSQWVYQVFETSQLLEFQQLENQLIEIRDTQRIENGLENTEKGKKDSPSKKKTQRQILIAQLQPHIKLANTILALIESGYVDGMNTPDTYMTIPHLEKYLPNLEELARMEATPEELKCLYSHFEPIYTSNKWSIGVKTFVEKLQAYRSMNGNSPSKEKETNPAHKLFSTPVPPPAKLSAAEIAAIKAGVKTQ